MNALLGDWDRPFGLPPFGAFCAGDFTPAFEAAMAAQRAEIAAIAADPAAPTFANTIEALEGAGRLLDRVAAVFFNLTGSDTTPELDAIQRDVAPKLSRLSSEMLLDPALFARIDALWETRGTLDLDAEAARVLELYHQMFVRAGARLDEAGRARMGEIMERLATLGTRFMQNLLKDEQDWEMVLEGEEDLAGLPPFVVDAAAGAAEERGRDGKHVVTLSRSLIVPFLTFSTRRELRERAFTAWVARGENGGETDNRAIMAETLRLRAERAGLLGFDTFAAFKLDKEMAKTPEAVRELLMAVWQPARARAEAEAAALEARAAEDGLNGPIRPWDWRLYAERERQALHDIDEAELKPHLGLDRVIEAAFDVAGRLFGLEFRAVEGLTLHHPDARAWEVMRGERHVGLFIGDYFARPSKRSGAWMSALRTQEKLAGDIRPIILNTCNFAKPAAGRPALLTLDDARTVFHEFGHALHGLMSDVRFPLVAGTNVARDFVELPSQLYEHWLTVPEVLSAHARHVETGAPIPEALIARIKAAETFNMGFDTVEYVASALLDLELHSLSPDAASELDVAEFEADVLARLGMPAAIVPRHRPPHFAHVFAGDGYSAGYYSYMWSEVMDSDAFAAFEETGNLFDPAVAGLLASHVFSAGGRTAPQEAYLAFRGRMPEVSALLSRRGLAA